MMPDVLVRGLAVGRLEVLRPPVEAPVGDPGRWSQSLLDVIRAMAHGHWAAPSGRPVVSTPRIPTGRPCAMIGIGASTGGPAALAEILADLPADLPVPILVVQHMAPGFLSGLIRWLEGTSALGISMAEDGVRPLPGRVYLAPEDRDLELDQGRHLRVGPSQGQYCPSADRLFLSMARELGAQAGAVILTGMGTDGAKGLLAVRQAKGATLAQDDHSSVVFGMPKAAIEIGAACEVLPLGRLAAAIRGLAGWHPPSTQGVQPHE